MSTFAKSRVFLALGGNLGEPRQTFRDAVKQIQQHPQIQLVATSSLYQTPAIGGPPGQPDYLNAVLELTTALSPQELLDFCQQIEDAAGRTREVRWAARTLDIDLLLYAQQTQTTATLKLPHPRLHERHFVLLPLVELAADFEHPKLRKSAAELLAALPPAEEISRLEKEWTTDD